MLKTGTTRERNRDKYGVSLLVDELNVTVKFARLEGFSSEICNAVRAEKLVAMTWATVLSSMSINDLWG